MKTKNKQIYYVVGGLAALIVIVIALNLNLGSQLKGMLTYSGSPAVKPVTTVAPSIAILQPSITMTGIANNSIVNGSTVINFSWTHLGLTSDADVSFVIGCAQDPNNLEVALTTGWSVGLDKTYAISTATLYNTVWPGTVFGTVINPDKTKPLYCKWKVSAWTKDGTKRLADTASWWKFTVLKP
jgi:hypothetical protein